MENGKSGANTEVESSKTPRRTFSVSKEFESILVEIDKMPNMSRFICEAIKERLERVKNPNKDIADALANFIQIQSIISQPMQAIQPMQHIEGQVATPSPSIPTASIDPSNGVEQKPAPAEPSIEKDKEKEKEEPVTESTQNLPTTKDENDSKVIEPELDSQKNDHEDEEVKRLREEALSKYNIQF